jgi:hypothetical protein
MTDITTGRLEGPASVNDSLAQPRPQGNPKQRKKAQIPNSPSAPDSTVDSEIEEDSHELDELA